MKSRNKSSKFVPPARVTTMLVMLAIVVGGLFFIVTTSLIAGIVIGILFALGFYGVVVVNARAAVGKRRRR